MNSIPSCQSDVWSTCLSSALQNSQYIGIDHGQFVLLDKKQGASTDNIQKLSLTQILAISRWFSNERSSNAMQIAESLQSIAKRSSIKHYSGVNCISELMVRICNGLTGKGFVTTEEQFQQLADNMLRLNRKPCITRYTKGETRTRALIPTVKEADGGCVGKGKTGKVFVHRNNRQLVVKKSPHDLTQEYTVVAPLHHRCIVRSTELFIKSYPNDTKKYKLVMEKVDGNLLTYYYEQKNHIKLSDATVIQLLRDVQDTMAYLFRHNVIWADLNSENAKVTPEGRLKLLDCNFWQKEQDPVTRAKALLLGAMQITEWIIKSSNVRLQSDVDKKNAQVTSFNVMLAKEMLFATAKDQERSIYRPPEFFTVPCINPYSIITATIMQGCMHTYYDRTDWMTPILEELKTRSNEGKVEYITRYVECVIAKFNDWREHSRTSHQVVPCTGAS